MTRRGPEDADFAAARDALVDRLAERFALSDRVAAAMRSVPRHEFVPEHRRDEAYADRPLPIGAGQTISAPHMVAQMVDLLGVSPGESVLEIGTGCGYHAAVVAAVVGAEGVYSVERVPDLAEAARDRLARLGFEAVSVRTGDGHEGWPANAPYDAAYLTCAAPSFPDAVVDQVGEGGRLLAPIGDRSQVLVRADRRPDGLDRERHGRVRFVRMQ